MTMQSHFLFRTGSSVVYEDTQKLMLKTMADLHLDVGISLVFSRMDEFCTAYQQARDVLEWNRRIPDSLKKQISWDRRYRQNIAHTVIQRLNSMN